MALANVVIAISSRESDHHKSGQEELLPILNESGQGERVRFVKSEIARLFDGRG